MVINDTLSLVRPSQLVNNYLALTKPGIIFGNLVTLTGGFFLAAPGLEQISLLFEAMLGLALVVASGCVLNNVIDRDIDGLMQRTRNRPTVRDAVTAQNALWFALLLGLGGFTVLSLTTNSVTVLSASLGYVIYAGVYSLYMKRHSVYGTLVGSLSGAVPPVVGYCAVSGHFDSAALLLLLLFSVWQMPHFYAIALFRLKDYQAAAIPVWPAVRGIDSTKRHMLLYILLFMASAAMLTWAGYTGLGFLLISQLLGLQWLRLVWRGWRAAEQNAWARQMFFYSIVVVCGISVALALPF